MFKAIDFGRGGCRDAEHSSCSSPAKRWNLFCLFESFRKKLLLDLKVENIAFVYTAQAILRRFLNLSIDNLSYRLQSLHRQYFLLFQSIDKQSFPWLFYVSTLAYSLLQIQHKPSFLLVVIPTQRIFSTCFYPKCLREAILDTSATFHLSVFIPMKISSV